MITQIIFCIIISAFHLTKAHQDGGGGPVCSEKAVAYWREKYYKRYTGDDEPEIRCDKEDGYCMRENESCKSKDWEHYNSTDWVRWQTTCYDKCYCCFNKERDEADKHYWYLHEERKTWWEAQAYCRGKGGSLLVPQNIADVLEFMRKEDIGTSDVWVGIRDFLGKYEGIDGNYIHNGWQIGQPRGTEKQGENCVALEDEDTPGMKVEPCYRENYFICNFIKDYKKGHNIYIDDMYNMNEIDLDRFGSKKSSGVYGKTIIIEDFRRSWQEARERCKDRGGDLLVPQKINDLVHYIRKLKLGDHDIWVGYSNRANSSSYSGNSFDGIHGNSIVSGWQSGEPRVLHTLGDEDCVVVEDDVTNGAGLKVQPCQEQHLYACDLSKDRAANYNTEQ